MVPDTFDASACLSATDCARALRDQGVTLGHRMAARVFGLGARGVRFSLAFLEEAAQGGEVASLLMDPAWMAEEEPPAARARRLLGARAAVVEQGGAVHVLTLDEHVPDSALAPAAEVSLLPVVLGASDPSTFQGLLWDRRRMEEAALALLDSEDPKELVEAFRYLFRATHACGQDPTSLLVTALRRGRLELSREVAALAREHLSRDFGRFLADLLSQDPRRTREALRFLALEEAPRWTPVLQAVLAPALTPLVEDARSRSVLFPALPELAPWLGAEPGAVEPLLDAVLAALPEVELTERFAASAFLVALRDAWPGVVPYLLRRLRLVAEPHEAAFYGNVLARQRPDETQRDEVIARMAELLREHGRDGALLQRLRATFRVLGTPALERLSESDYVRTLSPDARAWIVHLWNDRRQPQGLLPPEEEPLPEEVFARFAAGEILDHNRASLLALVRTGQVDRPALGEALRREDELPAVQDWLLEEASRMEDPDDRGVLDLVARLGSEVSARAGPPSGREAGSVAVGEPSGREAGSVAAGERPGREAGPVAAGERPGREAGSVAAGERLDPEPALVRAFASLRREAALQSGGEGARLRLFGRLAGRSAPPPELLDPLAEELLAFPFLGPEALPEALEGLGAVASLPGLSEDLRLRAVEVLSNPLWRFPEVRVEALRQVYPAAGEPTRRRIESTLRDVLEWPDHLAPAPPHVAGPVPCEPPGPPSPSRIGDLSDPGRGQAAAVPAPAATRATLHAALDGLEGMLAEGPMLLEVEALVADLCRTVLWKEREPSMEEVLRETLSESAAGDGVRLPHAWSREDRNQGLRILGAVARHPDTPERLHRMVVVRLFSFLQDWLEAVERGRDLYGHRDTPLWEILRGVLATRPGDLGPRLARDEAAVRLLELQRRHPEHLALARRENAQRFLLDLARKDDGTVRVRGVEISLRTAVVQTLMEVALHAEPETRATAGLLQELLDERVLPGPLQRELAAFLERLPSS